jgi:Xaa-Pro aminopeptidase
VYPEAFRGLGIRIEDDIEITTGFPNVLSKNAPKEINDIELIMKS